MQVTQSEDVILLSYADDLIFIADSQIKMKRILKALSTYCLTNSLTVNVKKTKIMIFQKGGNRSHDSFDFYYKKEKVEIVKLLSLKIATR